MSNDPDLIHPEETGEDQAEPEEDDEPAPAGYVCFLPACNYRTPTTGRTGRLLYDVHMRRHAARNGHGASEGDPAL